MALTIVVRASAGRSGDQGEGAPSDDPSMTFDSPRLVIGRGDGCDLRLPDPTVSHRHCSLRLRGTEWLVVDEGSTNGTALAGVKLAPQSPRVVKSGELVRLGRVWIELRIEPALPTPQPAAAAKELALDLVTRGLAAEGEDARPRVRVVRGPDAGKELVLEPGRRHVLGRSKEADLVLDDESASRRHVDVGKKGDHATVQDLGSKAGALLGGEPLGAGETAWRSGEVLVIGDDELELVYPAAEALTELERSPDEPLAPGEVPPAPGRDAREEPEVAAPEEPAAPGEAIERIPSAPPARSVAPDAGSGWGSMDLAIVVLAAGVLVLSIAGLIWLLRS